MCAAAAWAASALTVRTWPQPPHAVIIAVLINCHAAVDALNQKICELEADLAAERAKQQFDEVLCLSLYSRCAVASSPPSPLYGSLF